VIHGLTKFADWFADHGEKYVLIGGCAASAVMEEAGLTFRATKDLDVVLIVEAVDRSFAAMFFQFIETGGYQLRTRGAEGHPCFYRFSSPTDETFPKMIELFSRLPDLLRPLEEDNRTTPIPIDEDVPSLSAILLDEDAYRFVCEGRIEIGGIPFIDEKRLIPLKAQAWMDLSDRRAAHPESVDSRAVAKHLKDVVRLSELLTPNQAVELPGRLGEDMDRFLERARALPDQDLKTFGGRMPFLGALELVALVFRPVARLS
jgi:hypothetical protein